MGEKKNISMAIADAVEMELAQAKAIGWSEEGSTRSCTRNSTSTGTTSE